MPTELKLHTGNKTEMKKCTIKKIKRYTRKGKKKKMTDVHL